MNKELFLRFLDKSQIFVTLMTVIAILYFRSCHVIYFTIGSVLCAILAKFLKRLIRQPRPVHITKKGPTKPSYGMPSSHSQVSAFFATYISCVVKAEEELGLLRKIAVTVTLLYFSLVIWSRVRLGHHTLSQVTVGVIVGCSSALVWFLVYQDRRVQQIIQSHTEMLLDLSQQIY